MPIFGDPQARTFAPASGMARPMPMMGSDAIGSGNAFLFNPQFRKPKPGSNFGFNAGPGVASVGTFQTPAPNYGPLASNFSQLFTPQPQQTANPFQYF